MFVCGLPIVSLLLLFHSYFILHIIDSPEPRELFKPECDAIMSGQVFVCLFFSDGYSYLFYGVFLHLTVDRRRGRE